MRSHCLTIPHDHVDFGEIVEVFGAHGVAKRAASSRIGVGAGALAARMTDDSTSGATTPCTRDDVCHESLDAPRHGCMWMQSREGGQAGTHQRQCEL
jgi:hypothetical protein